MSVNLASEYFEPLALAMLGDDYWFSCAVGISAMASYGYWGCLKRLRCKEVVWYVFATSKTKCDLWVSKLEAKISGWGKAAVEVTSVLDVAGEFLLFVHNRNQFSIPWLGQSNNFNHQHWRRNRRNISELSFKPVDQYLCPLEIHCFRKCEGQFQGRPFTRVFRPSEMFFYVGDTPDGKAICMTGWELMATAKKHSAVWPQHNCQAYLAIRSPFGSSAMSFSARPFECKTIGPGPIFFPPVRPLWCIATIEEKWLSSHMFQGLRQRPSALGKIKDGKKIVKRKHTVKGKHKDGKDGSTSLWFWCPGSSVWGGADRSASSRCLVAGLGHCRCPVNQQGGAEISAK